MTASRVLPASLLAVVGVGLATLAVACGGEPAKSPASPASSSAPSEPELNGTYKSTGATTGSSTWTITACGRGCADIAVKADTGDDSGDTLALPFSGRAYLANGEWSMKVVRKDGYLCASGADAAVDAIYSWNATSLKGSWDATLHGPACGKPAGAGTGSPEPFTLNKVN